MIIVHEGLPTEAFEMAKTFEKVFGVKSRLIKGEIGSVLNPLPKFDGYMISDRMYQPTLSKKLKIPEGKASLLLTRKDLFYNDENKDDDWVFGVNVGNTSLVSTARMKRLDNKPSQRLEVPFDLYIRRLLPLAIHEVGHDVVDNPRHYQEAIWINEQRGYELPLGPHCTDNRCVMYEVVDVTEPKEGYMQLGNERKYDAWLDSLIKRIYPDWFCEPCKSSIKIDERYV